MSASKLNKVQADIYHHSIVSITHRVLYLFLVSNWLIDIKFITDYY